MQVFSREVDQLPWSAKQTLTDAVFKWCTFNSERYFFFSDLFLLFVTQL